MSKRNFRVTENTSLKLVKAKTKISGIFKGPDESSTKRKKKILTWIFWGALIVSICLSACIGMSTKKSGEGKTRHYPEESLEIKPSVGYLAPNIEGITYNKRTFLCFFRLDSDASLSQLKALNELYSQTELENFQLIGIVEGTTESALKEFMSDKEYEFTVISDSFSEIWDKFAVISMPMSFLVEKDGTISNMRVGTMSLNDLLKFAKISN